MKPSTVSVTLEAAPAAAGQARRLLSHACHEASLPESLCDDAVLLVSELVTNVVLHGGRHAHLSVSADVDGVRVGVSDDGAARPRIARSDLLAESGRGLRLLDKCASCWGVQDDDPGKTVWFELHVAPHGGLRLVR